MDKTVLIVSLIIGSALIATTCFVFIKYHKFGTGGGLLTLSGVILLGLSVWKSFVIPTPWGDLKAELKETQKEISNIKDNVQVIENKLGAMTVQNILTNKGYYSGPIDGMLGSKLQEALVQFQKANKLPPTGKIDLATSEKLGINIPSIWQINLDHNLEFRPKTKTDSIPLGVKQ